MGSELIGKTATQAPWKAPILMTGDGVIFRRYANDNLRKLVRQRKGKRDIGVRQKFLYCFAAICV
jgi:hypothetical protein